MICKCTKCGQEKEVAAYVDDLPWCESCLLAAMEGDSRAKKYGMGKAVLMSVKPRWCQMIASGKKTIEVRKNKPLLEPPFRCYIYCSMPKTNDPHQVLEILGSDGEIRKANGNVIGEFVCDKVLDICIFSSEKNMHGLSFPYTGLTDREIMDYLGNGKTGYGWHISDLLIYDKPKKLSEYFKYRTLSNEEFLCQLYDGRGGPRHSSYAGYLFTQAIRRPPQSWCYVEAGKEGAE